MAQENKEQLAEGLIDAASSAIYGSSTGRRVRQFSLINRTAKVADAQSIYVLDGEFVLYVAPKDFPEVSNEQFNAMLAMRAYLDQQGARVIPEVIGHGHFQNRSYLIVPHCRPLASGRITRRIDQFRITKNVLQWLRLMASCSSLCSNERIGQFEASLEAMQSNNALPDRIRRGSDKALINLNSHPGIVKSVPMHGDLWQCNILRQKDGTLAIIDWAGSCTVGYGVYDLIRFADSFRLSRSKLRRELNWHAGQLGGEPGVVLPMHLLGALGHYALNLNEFPFERFLPLAIRCYDKLVEGM